MAEVQQIQITPQDIAEGEEIDFAEEPKEIWQTYRLSDGTTLKVKFILIGVRRLKKFNPVGDPIYMINTQNVVRAVSVPEKLKAKPKESTFKPT
jgi:hypothetical protein